VTTNGLQTGLAPATGAQSERLLRAKVLVVGIGGLGCPAAALLARAGVGTIGLIDPDRIDLSNLHRQILYTSADVGRLKVPSARDKLTAIRSGLTVPTFETALTPANLADLFAGFDFVIDGTDNVPAKFLINDGAVLTGTPYSHAGILGFRGQTMTVLPRQSACYRCLFPVAPPAGEVPTCQEAGVVGVVGGALGIVQAAEAIKYLCGDGELLTDRLLTFDALAVRWRAVRLRRSPLCPVCGDRPSIHGLSQDTHAA